MTAASYPISRGSPRQSTESAEALFRHSIANFCSGSSIVGSNSSVQIALSLVRVPTSGDQDVDRGDRPVYHDRQSARGNHPSGRRPRQTDRAVSAAQGAATHPPEMKVPTLLAVARHRGTEISNPSPSSRQSVSFRISPWFLEKPGFSASVGRMPDGAVGRDAPVQQHRAEEPVVSLSGDISVPQCRRCGSRQWGRRRQARLRRSRFSNIDKA